MFSVNMASSEALCQLILLMYDPFRVGFFFRNIFFCKHANPSDSLHLYALRNVSAHSINAPIFVTVFQHFQFPVI